MPTCTCTYIFCDQNDRIARVLLFQDQAKQYGIYPQHQPVLIHKPFQMATRLAGFEFINPPGGQS
jgi:hypothetical protein